MTGCISLDWFEHAPGFVAFLAGPDFVFAHANDAYKRLVGRDELLGLPLVEALPELVEQGIDVLCRDVVERAERYVERGRAIRLRSPDDGALHCRYVDFVIQPIPARDGPGVAGLLVQGCDVTMEMVSRGELHYTLTHDVLTGLPNYALFRDRLEQAVHGAERAHRPLLVAALDLDLFKRVNAWLGHDAGDRALQEIARRIVDTAGAEATVARENSDKFLLLLETEHGPIEPDRLSRIAEAVAAPIDHDGRQVRVSCCIGLASYPLNGQSADALMVAVNRALGQAKAAGPGILQRDDSPPDHAEMERFQLGFALRDALARSELKVHYQPQVDLVTGTVCAVEALVRWTTAEGQEIAPATLIGVAEECGLIGELGDWVLRTACAQAAQWRQLGFTSLRVAVNLSARQFSMPGLAASVVRALADCGLPPQCLDLELTESVLMNDFEHAAACLVGLKQRGVRLCLDDFGTGYSSLAYLQRLPIDVLKIDKSFLQRVPEADDASAIVDAIISMGHSLGMRVIAEGVEREAQCDFLSRHMCDEVQGYYIAAPMPAAALTALLGRQRVLAEHLLRFNRRVPTLLLVDDEPSIVSSLKRLLRNDGYHILTACNGAEGLRVLSEHRVDVIVSDQRMPGMTGVEFLRSARQLSPDTVRIVLSGFTELQTVTDAVNAGAIYKFLTKPWDDAQLRGHIQEAFAYRAMANENRLLTLELSTANQQLAAVNRQLETVLAQQRREIERGEISLDIVHEVLGNVPMAVLACDERGMIVLANRAAAALLGEFAPLLGREARSVLPGMPATLPASGHVAFELRVGGAPHHAELRPMSSGAQARGWLIAVTGARTPG